MCRAAALEVRPPIQALFWNTKRPAVHPGGPLRGVWADPLFGAVNHSFALRTDDACCLRIFLSGDYFKPGRANFDRLPGESRLVRVILLGDHDRPRNPTGGAFNVRGSSLTLSHLLHMYDIARKLQSDLAQPCCDCSTFL